MATNAIFVVGLTLASFVATAIGVTWTDCGSKEGTPSNVVIQGCEAAGVCILHKNVNVSFSIDFTAKEDTSALTMKVYGHIAGVDVPFPLPNPDGCKGSGISCPVKNGNKYTYSNALFVKDSYPSLSLGVKLELLDKSDQAVFCVMMPVKIEGSSGNALRFESRKL